MFESIAEAFKELFKFLSKLLDRLPVRGRQIKKSKCVPPPQVPQVSPKLTVNDMLKILSKDIKWLSLQEDQSVPMTNICWALQLTFQRLQHSRDGAEISEILSNMRKLNFKKALKRFAPDCQGLATMLNAICYCCTLYETEQEIQDLSSTRAKQISSDGIKLCGNLLLPFAKRSRSKKQKLFSDTLDAIGNSIETFSKALIKYSSDWPEDLGEQLEQTVGIVPFVLRNCDFPHNGIQEKLKAFANQIPPALDTLSKKHPEKWLPVLQSLCNKKGPQNIGPLCKFWRRLVCISRYNGFEFLKELFETTIESVCAQVESGIISTGQDGEAAMIIGCLHDLVEQCCRAQYDYLGYYWKNIIQPSVVVLQNKCLNNSDLGSAQEPVIGYLDKIILLIDDFPKVSKKNECSTGAKDIPPVPYESEDTLYGLESLAV